MDSQSVADFIAVCISSGLGLGLIVALVTGR